MSKNDQAWKKYFNKTKVLDDINQNGYSYVDASHLKNIAQREPRLLAKIDTSAVLPNVFRENDLTIFPVKNGRYIIFKDPDRKTYFDFKDALDNISIEEYDSRVQFNKFDTFPKDSNLNESQAIDFSYITSLLTTFFNDKDLNLTIRGRIYSNEFDFTLPSSQHKAEVSGVQIEVDSGYESDKAIYIIEAKVGKREDFNIRQLYYPYLHWSTKTNKNIVPVFLIYTNGKFYLNRFDFSEQFGELALVENKCFTINESAKPIIKLDEIIKLNQDNILDNDDSPFPQADDLDKVADLIFLAQKEEAEKDRIANYFEFDQRQADYYANAAVYLGFIERTDIGFTLTSFGEEFVRTDNRSQRVRLLVGALASDKVFKEVLNLLVLKKLDAEKIDNQELARIIEGKRDDISGDTLNRRAITIKAWLRWLRGNCELR